MKILIVEDSQLSRRMLIQTLKRDDYKITVAIDGSDAMKKMKLDTPDLVITDIMMPFVSGLELVSWIKENFDDNIKIIILTSLGDEEVVLEAFSLGVDDFITKPFDYDDLCSRIERFK
ncbi:MAG: response regulator [Polaribacter sp.]|uniref:response regulator n=1 Tax=Polaribacter sp. TaxID=1920175 RepID=UPI0032675758